MRVPPFLPREGLILALPMCQNIDNCVTFLNTPPQFPLSSQLAFNLHHPGRHRRLLFSAAARIRRARNHCKSEVVTKVLSTPVPVPVRNRLTPQLGRVRPEWSRPWRGIFWLRPHCRDGHRMRGPDAALNRKHFPSDYKCRQCFQWNRLDSIRVWSRRSHRNSAS